MDVVLVVDVANVMGSRPDGWWRDRAGAAGRLVGSLAAAATRSVPLGGTGTHGPGDVRVVRVVAVLEGRARTAQVPDDVAAAVDVRLAAADGDTCVVEVAGEVLASGGVPLVVTADRGLRDRLPDGATVAGPRALLDVLDALAAGS